MVAEKAEASGATKNALATADATTKEQQQQQQFIPTETMFTHLGMLSDDLKLVNMKELEEFKEVYVLMCQSERSGFCAGTILDGLFNHILDSFSPLFTVCIPVANVLRDIVKCNIDANRMLFRHIEDIEDVFNFTIAGLRRNMDKYIQASTQVNLKLLDKCNELIAMYKDDPANEKIIITANYTKAAVHRNIGDGYRYYAELDLSNDEIKEKAGKNYDISIELSKNFLPKGINLQYLNTHLNAAVFKFDLCQKRQEAFDELLEVFNIAKKIVYPLIAEHESGENTSNYMNANFPGFQLIFQVLDTNLREWSKLYGFHFEGSEIMYSEDSQDENEDENSWLDYEKDSSGNADEAAGNSEKKSQTDGHQEHKTGKDNVDKVTSEVKNIRI